MTRNGKPIRPEHLGLGPVRHAAVGEGPSPSGVLPFPATLDEIEAAATLAMLEECGGNKSEAARRLGITRSRLYRILRRGEL